MISKTKHKNKNFETVIAVYQFGLITKIVSITTTTTGNTVLINFISAYIWSDLICFYLVYLDPASVFVCGFVKVNKVITTMVIRPLDHPT